MVQMFYNDKEYSRHVSWVRGLVMFSMSCKMSTEKKPFLVFLYQSSIYKCHFSNTMLAKIKCNWIPFVSTFLKYRVQGLIGINEFAYQYASIHKP